MTVARTPALIAASRYAQVRRRTAGSVFAAAILSSTPPVPSGTRAAKARRSWTACSALSRSAYCSVRQATGPATLFTVASLVVTATGRSALGVESRAPTTSDTTPSWTARTSTRRSAARPAPYWRVGPSGGFGSRSTGSGAFSRESRMSFTATPFVVDNSTLDSGSRASEARTYVTAVARRRSARVMRRARSLCALHHTGIDGSTDLRHHVRQPLGQVAVRETEHQQPGLDREPVLVRAITLEAAPVVVERPAIGLHGNSNLVEQRVDLLDHLTPVVT